MEEHPFLDELPLYALGALAPEEGRNVELHLLEGCQTCGPALIHLQNVAGSLPYSIARTGPPADLKKPKADLSSGDDLTMQKSACAAHTWIPGKFTLPAMTEPIFNAIYMRNVANAPMHIGGFLLKKTDTGFSFHSGLVQYRHIVVDVARDEDRRRAALHRLAIEQRLGVSHLFYAENRIRALGERTGFAVLPLAPLFQAQAEQRQVFLHGFENSGIHF